MKWYLSAVIACCLIGGASGQITPPPDLPFKGPPPVPWVEWDLIDLYAVPKHHICLYVSGRIEATVNGSLIPVPDQAHNASVDYTSSTCHSILGNGTTFEQIITIQWEVNSTTPPANTLEGPPPPPPPPPGKWNLSFHFSNDGKYNKQRNSSYYSCYKITLYGEFVDEVVKCTTEDNENPVDYSFLGNLAPNKATLCKTERTAKLGKHCTLVMRNSIYKAFIPDWKSYNDTSLEICKDDEIKKDWIPIIVGACLTGIVLVVTIGYLIKVSRTPVVQPEFDEPKPPLNNEFTHTINPDLEKDNTVIQDKF